MSEPPQPDESDLYEKLTKLGVRHLKPEDVAELMQLYDAEVWRQEQAGGAEVVFRDVATTQFLYAVLKLKHPNWAAAAKVIRTRIMSLDFPGLPIRRAGIRGNLKRIEESERRRHSDPASTCGRTDPHPAHEQCPGSE